MTVKKAISYIWLSVIELTLLGLCATVGHTALFIALWVILTYRLIGVAMISVVFLVPADATDAIIKKMKGNWENMRQSCQVSAVLYVVRGLLAAYLGLMTFSYVYALIFTVGVAVMTTLNSGGKAE